MSTTITIRESEQTLKRLAEIRVLTPISVVIPTDQGSENVTVLLDRINTLREIKNIKIEVLLMICQSGNMSIGGSEELRFDWVQMVVQERPRGLGEAIVDGIRLARHQVVVVMDADLSHPPEKIPELIFALASGQQFAIGSRYRTVGNTGSDEGTLRLFYRMALTLLTRPLTTVSDPMTGFFAFRRSQIDDAPHLNPIGDKVGLELIVKCGLDDIGEVAIRSDGAQSQRKRTFKDELNYIKHVRRLYIFKYKNLSSLAQFMVVGASGTIVNLGVLTLLVWLGVSKSVAVACAIGVSIVNNFLLNRRFTFSYARTGSIWRQFLGFLGASTLGSLVNFGVTLAVESQFDQIPLQVAALIGIAGGMGFNFLINRFVVFREKTPRTNLESTETTSSATSA